MKNDNFLLKGTKNIHFIAMWSIPYNMHFYNSHFGLGMVHLSTKFTRDMLPYWYKRIYEGGPGSYKRGKAGKSVVFKHKDVFILGHLQVSAVLSKSFFCTACFSWQFHLHSELVNLISYVWSLMIFCLSGLIFTQSCYMDDT